MIGTVYAAYPINKAKPLEAESQPRALRRTMLGPSAAGILGGAIHGYDYMGERVGPAEFWPGESAGLDAAADCYGVERQE